MLKKKFYKYLRSLLIFSVLIIVTYIVLWHFANELVSTNTPFLIIAFLVVTASTHYIITKTDVERIEYKPNPDLEKEAQKRELMNIEHRFISKYMIITIVKLLSFIALLGLYAYFNTNDMIRFSLNFLAIYLLYSLFEIIYVQNPIKK